MAILLSGGHSWAFMDSRIRGSLMGIGLALRELTMNAQKQMHPIPNQVARSQIVGENCRTVYPSALSSDGIRPGRIFQ